MDKKKITVLMVEPGKHPMVTTLDNDLDSLQKAVSIGADYQGLIEIIGIGKSSATRKASSLGLTAIAGSVTTSLPVCSTS